MAGGKARFQDGGKPGGAEAGGERPRLNSLRELCPVPASSLSCCPLWPSMGCPDFRIEYAFS